MILFFNPRSAPSKPRIPLSLLALMRMFDQGETVLIDGNLLDDPLPELQRVIREKSISVLAMTVMPGPQVPVAIRVSRSMKAEFPDLDIIWGGFFASFQADVILTSPWVDAVLRGPGEKSFVDYIRLRSEGVDLSNIPGLSFRHGGSIEHGPPPEALHLDELPAYPWDRVPVQRYLGRTFLGTRTINYCSSYGCPFACKFCAVNTLSNHRWNAESPSRVISSVSSLIRFAGANALEFHDNNFFVSESRVREIATGLRALEIGWWGEGRLDTLLEFDTATWELMASSGLKMIFTGAESGHEDHLRALGKEGINREKVLDFTNRCKTHGIIPEFSFMLGAGEDPFGELAATKELIRTIKSRNPLSIIVLYLYSPVAMTPQADFLTDQRFSFPNRLEDWEKAPWSSFDLRRGAYAPWLPSGFSRAVHDFETVLNARFPAITDISLPGWARSLLPSLSEWRYRHDIMEFPWELRAVQKIADYRRPEVEGL